MRVSLPLCLLLLLTASSQAGCGILLQSVVGWSDTRAVTRQVPYKVEIDSDPPSTAIERELDGETMALGSTPLTDKIEVTMEDTLSETRVYMVVLGGALELAGMIAGIAGFIATCPDGGDCSAGFPVLAGVSAMSGIIDLTVSLLAGSIPDEIESTKIAKAPRVIYRATRPGHEPGIRQLVVKDDEQIQFRLPLFNAVPPPGPIRVVKEKAVIAVMPVSMTAHSAELAPELMASLEDQLRVDLAREGLHTVDRGAQDALLQAEISSLQADSYKSCYDEACQIELGKALAASHLLRTRLARFGSQCVLNSELIDLSLEVSIAAGSARGGCQPEAFLEMSGQLTRDLLATRGG